MLVSKTDAGKGLVHTRDQRAWPAFRERAGGVAISGLSWGDCPISGELAPLSV